MGNATSETRFGVGSAAAVKNITTTMKDGQFTLWVTRKEAYGREGLGYHIMYCILTIIE